MLIIPGIHVFTLEYRIDSQHNDVHIVRLIPLTDMYMYITVERAVLMELMFD